MKKRHETGKTINWEAERYKLGSRKIETREHVRETGKARDWEPER
jgi:hypothetical protein